MAVASPVNLPGEKLILAQVMAWCHQATSHYLSQCWPRFMASLGHNELNESCLHFYALCTQGQQGQALIFTLLCGNSPSCKWQVKLVVLSIPWQYCNHNAASIVVADGLVPTSYSTLMVQLCHNTEMELIILEEIFVHDYVIKWKHFYTPVWKTGRIMPWQCPSVRLSVCPSVRPSVRPSVWLLSRRVC